MNKQLIINSKKKGFAHQEEPIKIITETKHSYDFEEIMK